MKLTFLIAMFSMTVHADPIQERFAKAAAALYPELIQIYGQSTQARLSPAQPVSMGEFKKAMKDVEEVAIWSGREDVRTQYRSQVLLEALYGCGGPPGCRYAYYAVYDPEQNGDASAVTIERILLNAQGD